MKDRLGMADGAVTRSQMNLAAVLMHRGAYDEAEALYRQILDIRRQDYGDDDPDVAATLRSLGTLYYLRSDFAAAEPLLRQALEVRRAALGDDDTSVASVWSSLGRVLQGQGKLDEAAAAFEKALTIRQDRLGDEHLHTALTRKDLASLYFARGDAQAQTLWERAMTVLEAELPADSWELADAHSQLGERLAAAGRLAAARPLLLESYRILAEQRGAASIYAREAKARMDRFLR